MSAFITLWIGAEFLLQESVLIVIAINMFSTLMRGALGSFKEAAGIFHQDRYVPLMEAAVNIIASIIFLNIFGLAGVFIGTVTSTLLLHLYSYPNFVYNPLFKKSVRSYYQELAGYTLIASIIISATYILSRQISFSNALIEILVKALFVMLLPNILLYFVYRKSQELLFFKGMIIKGIQNILVKKHEK